MGERDQGNNVNAGDEAAAEEDDEPVRIVVRCLSHKIPGDRYNRTMTMANILSKKHFKRESDANKDQIRSMGLLEIGGKKVRFLFESGRLEASTRLDDVPILAKSGEEMRASMDDEHWNLYMREVFLRKLQYEMRADRMTRSWVIEHPKLFDKVMQEHTARKKYHKLGLSAIEQQWVGMPKESQSDLPLIQFVLKNMGRREEEAKGESSTPSSAAAGPGGVYGGAAFKFRDAATV